LNKASISLSTRLKDTPLLWRIFTFVVIFLVVSGTVGPRIISHGLVGTDGFQVYGGSGKALLFAALCFGILIHKSWGTTKTVVWQHRNIIWLLLSVVSYAILWVAVSKLQQHAPGLIWPVLTHICILATILCALIGTIGLANLRKLHQTFRKELLVSLGLGIGFYIFLTAVYGLWHILSTAVIHAVSWLLNLSGLYVVVLPHNVLLLDKFSVAVSEYCSGIESIALFTGLYALVGIIDRDKLNFRKYSAVFLPALILLFGCNIVRVYGLIMAGYYINPHIAFSLFHTYAGMIFFVIYSAIFWRLAYSWMLRKQNHR
jgi:exosortase/archaeosortase family protein